VHVHPVEIARLLERSACPLGELRQALDGVHLRRELGEHGRLVAGAGADVEHALAACSASSSQIRATMYGCDIVWPKPIGRAASSYARARSSGGRKSSRGTRSIAASTRSSWMPGRGAGTRHPPPGFGRISGMRERPRVDGRLDPEVPQDRGRDVGDPRGRSGEADREHGDERVARDQRAVAAAARMVPPPRSANS